MRAGPSWAWALGALVLFGGAAAGASLGLDLGDPAFFWPVAAGVVAAAMAWATRRSETSWASQAPLLLFALLAAVTVTAAASWRPTDWDWTSQGVRRLNPETLALLEALEAPVSATMFATERGEERPPAERLRDRLGRVSGKVDWSWLNPVTSPLEVERYDARRGDLFLELGDRRERVRPVDEEGFANALLRLTRGERTACFTQGHGEPPVLGDDAVRAAIGLLEEKAIATRTLDLFDPESALGAGCDVVLAVGPTGPFLEQELASLDALLGEVGLVVLMDPEAQGRGPLAEWLAGHGLAVGRDPVVDVTSADLGLHPLQAIVPAAGLDPFHPATKGIDQNLLFEIATEVASGPGWRSTALATSAEWTWLESELEAEQWVPDEHESQGAVPLVIAAESDGGARVALAGDSDWIDDLYFLTYPSHGDLFLGVTRWAMGPGETLDLPAGDRGLDPLAMTNRGASRLALAYLAGVVFLLAEGIAIQVGRRRR